MDVEDDDWGDFSRTGHKKNARSTAAPVTPPPMAGMVPVASAAAPSTGLPAMSSKGPDATASLRSASAAQSGLGLPAKSSSPAVPRSQTPPTSSSAGTGHGVALSANRSLPPPPTGKAPAPAMPPLPAAQVAQPQTPHSMPDGYDVRLLAWLEHALEHGHRRANAVFVDFEWSASQLNTLTMFANNMAMMAQMVGVQVSPVALIALLWSVGVPNGMSSSQGQTPAAACLPAGAALSDVFGLMGPNATSLPPFMSAAQVSSGTSQVPVQSASQASAAFRSESAPPKPQVPSSASGQTAQAARASSTPAPAASRAKGQEDEEGWTTVPKAHKPRKEQVALVSTDSVRPKALPKGLKKGSG